MFATRYFVKPTRGLVPGLVATLLVLGTAANADPLVTMDEVGAAIMSCWKPPVGVEKSTVTLVFSFKSDGSLVGPPTSTFVEVTGDDQVRQIFVAAAVDAVDQ